LPTYKYTYVIRRVKYLVDYILTLGQTPEHLTVTVHFTVTL